MFRNIFGDKSLNAKTRVMALAEYFSTHPNELKEFIEFARASKDPIKADSLEALEHITLDNPEFGDKTILEFASENLNSKAARVRWEASRLIANCIHLYKNQIKNVLVGLLENTEHEGTVVRWSAAQALSSILSSDSSTHKTLIPAIKSIIEREEKESIKKIYLKALKSISKQGL